MKNETYASPLARFFLQEDLNFLVTNRLPRRWATKFAGWFTRIESRPLTRVGLAVWKWFADDLRLDEAMQSDFKSLHECFIRELKPGARPIDSQANVAVSPCDAVVGEMGRVVNETVFQAKGFPYTLGNLFCDSPLAKKFEGGQYVTLRLKANMYHRFHAPTQGQVQSVSYISGDTWNVNPIALERVERLFCKNERAIVEFQPHWSDVQMALVPVAAILVASIRFNFLNVPLDLKHRGLRHFFCTAQFEKGQEMGRFEAGSTILLFVKGPLAFAEKIQPGATVRMGEALFHYQPLKGHTS